MIGGSFSHDWEPEKSLFFIKYSALCVLLQQQKADERELPLNSDTLCLIRFCGKISLQDCINIHAHLSLNRLLLYLPG